MAMCLLPSLGPLQLLRAEGWMLQQFPSGTEGSGPPWKVSGIESMPEGGKAEDWWRQRVAAAAADSLGSEGGQNTLLFPRTFVCLGKSLDSSAHSEVTSSPEADRLRKYVTAIAGVCILGDSKTYEAHNQPTPPICLTSINWAFCV